MLVEGCAWPQQAHGKMLPSGESWPAAVSVPSCLPGSIAGCSGALWTKAAHMASVLHALSYRIL